MASLHISLSDEMRAFVDTQVSGGAYHNHSEYVRDLIRHDQERRTQMQMDTLLLQGLESGTPMALTADDWQEIREQVRARARQRRPANG
jgi:antitoxin ParD1/3/4